VHFYTLDTLEEDEATLDSLKEGQHHLLVPVAVAV
jgi:hypothetical protein